MNRLNDAAEYVNVNHFYTDSTNLYSDENVEVSKADLQVLRDKLTQITSIVDDLLYK
jgi:hypothetical protein